MTIVEIKNQLITHFYDNDSFDLDTDGKKIQIDDEMESMRSATIRAILGDLESSGIVKCIESSEKTIWILVQSFHTFTQSVTISAASAEIIGDTINMFRDANDINGDVCDKMKITESDILNLVNICHVLLESEPIDFDEDQES